MEQDKAFILGHKIAQLQEQLKAQHNDLANQGISSDQLGLITRAKQAALRQMQFELDKVVKEKEARVSQGQVSPDQLKGPEFINTEHDKSAYNRAVEMKRLQNLMLQKQNAAPASQESVDADQERLQQNQLNEQEALKQYPQDMKQNQMETEAAPAADGRIFSDASMNAYKKTHSGTNKTVAMTETPPAKASDKKMENFGPLEVTSDGYAKGGSVGGSKEALLTGTNPAGGFNKKSLKDVGTTIVKQVAGPVGKKVVAAAMPIVGALSQASDAMASDDLGPAEGSEDRDIEMGKKPATKVEAPIRNPGEYLDTNLADGGQPGGVPELYMADGGELMQFNAEQLGKGVRTELEHGPDANQALKITKDHLQEMPKYYSKLEKMEGKKLAKGGEVSAKLQKGDVVPGSEDQFAGDTVPAMLNKGELVLNVEHQQKLIDKINGRTTQLPKERVDNLLNEGKASIDKEQQDHLFKFIKGETEDAPKGHIIRYNHAEGDSVGVMAPDQEQKPNSIPDWMWNLAGKSSKTPDWQSPAAETSTASAITPPLAPEAIPTEQSVVPKADPEVLKLMQAQQQNQKAAVATGPSTIPTAPTGYDYLNINPKEIDINAKAAQGAVDAANKQIQVSQQNFDNAKKLRDQITVDTQAEIAKQQQQLEAMKQSSGMTKFFQNESTLGKIFFGTALALSTLSSLKTGSNPVLDYIKGNIDNEIKTQQLTGTNALAMKDFMLKQQDADMAMAQSKTQNATALANLAQARQSIQQEALKNKIQWNQSVYGMKIMQSAAQGNQSGQGVPTAALESFGPEYAKRAVPLPDGTRAVFAGDEASATKAKESLFEVNNFKNELTNLIDLGYRGRALPIASPQRAEYEAAATIAASRLKQAFQNVAARGNVGQGIEEVQSLLGNPQAIFRWSPSEQAKAFSVLNSTDNQIRQIYSIYAKTPNVDLGPTSQTARAFIQKGDSPATAYKKIFDTKHALQRQ